MEDTPCIDKKKQMTTLRKLDTEEDRNYWAFIEKTAQQSREQRPAWAKELEQRKEEQSLQADRERLEIKLT